MNPESLAKWFKTYNNLKNKFEIIQDGKTLFHYACLRGNKIIIQKYLDTNSDKIYLSDNTGNTGLHLIAFNEFDKMLIEIVNLYPIFLKLINLHDEFIYDIVKSRYKTLKEIVNIMIKNNYITYLNYVKESNRTLFLDIIDLCNDNKKYYEILSMLHNVIDLTQPITIPPLLYAMNNKYDDITMYLLKTLKTNVNIVSENHISPLIIAIMNKNIDIINQILLLNPDVNYSGFENKKNPLSLCFKNELFDTAIKIMNFKLVNYNEQDEYLNIPICYFIYTLDTKNSNHIKILKKLVLNSDLNTINIHGETPLLLLTKYNLWKYVKSELSQKKLNINNLSRINESPLSPLSEEDLNEFTNIIEESIHNNMIYDFTKKNILLPETKINENFGLFNSSSIHSVIYMLIMIEKYKNITMPTQSNNNDKKLWEMYNITNNSVITDNSVDSLNQSVLQYYSIFYRLIPSLILWKDKDIYFMENDNIYLKKCINIPIEINRFVIYKLIFILETTLHANIVIYDKQLNKVIRFEPYGDFIYNDAHNLDEHIYNIFKKSLDDVKRKSLKYIKPSDFLDKTKFQTSSMGDNTIEKNLGDPGGYCLAWCLWFLELKLKNPDDDEILLVENAFNKIILNNKNIDNPLLYHIRSYAKHLDDEKNLLLKKIGINEQNLYKLYLNNNDIKLIQNFIQDYQFN
jgi:hypothetical protein